MAVQIVGLKSNRALKLVDRLRTSLLLGAQQSQIFQQDRILWLLAESLKPFALRTHHISSVPIDGPEVRAREPAIRGRGERMTDKGLLIAPNHILAHRFDDANDSKRA